jgi:hypothetical protein
MNIPPDAIETTEVYHAAEVLEMADSLTHQNSAANATRHWHPPEQAGKKTGADAWAGQKSASLASGT